MSNENKKLKRQIAAIVLTVFAVGIIIGFTINWYDVTTPKAIPNQEKLSSALITVTIIKGSI